MLRKAKIFLVNSRKLHIPCLKISEEVKQALSEKRPVVSLESTIYTHGFPYPENYSLAKEVEKVVKNSGAVPATCGFIKGKPVVGLDTQELAYLTEQRSANKVSRRDIGYTISKEVNGGTTIASTMILSNLAGINVFATGGLGGVHRDGQFTMDISADLTELGRTPVAVVCSGPKSILDIERTMEYLETQGVFVGTYNDDNRAEVQVPGFYTRESGVLSPYAFSSFREAASIISNSKSMMLNSGHLFCIPPPKDIALESNYIDSIIEAANISAKEKAITGKRLTPYLLKQIAEATNGRSVTCNYDFVLNNAKCGSEIAKELCKLEKVSTSFQPSTSLKTKIGNRNAKLEEYTRDSGNTVDVVDTVIVGSIAIDSSCKLQSDAIMFDSNPGNTQSTLGGVGFNIHLAHTYSSDTPSRLVSIVGDDIPSSALLSQLKERNSDVSGIKHVQGSTAQYTSIHKSNGELIIACADMHIIESDFSDHIIKQIQRANPKNIVLDCNLSQTVIRSILEFIEENLKDCSVIVEPTSAPKSKRLAIIPKRVYPNNFVRLITPTKAELMAIFESFQSKGFFDDYDEWFPVIDSLGVDTQFREKLLSKNVLKPLISDGILQQAINLLPYFQNVLIKLGKQGVLLVSISENVEDFASIPTTSKYKPDFTIISKGGPLGIVVQYFDIPKENKDIVIQNVSGAGDALLGFLISRLQPYNWLSSTTESAEQEWNKWEAIYKAQLASGFSLVSKCPINEDMKSLNSSYDSK